MLTEKVLENVKKMCEGKTDIKFTVAVMQGDKVEKKLYGCNGEELPYQEYHYEIGSITKTFTAAILARALKDGILSLEDRIDTYIPELKADKVYPTIRRLATHTSGYPADTEEFEKEFLNNDQENQYNRYTYETMLQVIDDIQIEDRDYEACYSNFGIGVLGVVLEKACHKSIHELMEEMFSEMELEETFIGFTDRKGLDIEGYNSENKSTGNLLWNRDCIIGAAGFLFSTAEDLLKYARVQIEDSTGYLHQCHENLAHYQRGEGLPMDIGLCWVLIPDYNIMFHNGGTRSFHTILCINKQINTAVILLCNYMLDDVSTTALRYLIELTSTE